jgi:hypothetical protein
MFDIVYDEYVFLAVHRCLSRTSTALTNVLHVPQIPTLSHIHDHCFIRLHTINNVHHRRRLPQLNPTRAFFRQAPIVHR